MEVPVDIIIASAQQTMYEREALLAELERAIRTVCIERHGGAFDRPDMPRYSCAECRAQFPKFHQFADWRTRRDAELANRV